MAKGTNSSKCLGTAYGCNVRTDKALTNDGFKLAFSVVVYDFFPDHDQVRSLSRTLEKIIVNRINYLSSLKLVEENQKELFDGLC